jgi:hypothetical protein
MACTRPFRLYLTILGKERSNERIHYEKDNSRLSPKEHLDNNLVSHPVTKLMTGEIITLNY